MILRILTYNIHRAIGVDREFDPDRIVRILRHHNADIALLQEVDRGHPRSDHMDLASYIARKLDYAYRAVGMNVHFKRGKYGNATLSRFPIGRQRNIDLTIGNIKRRGAQHTRIEIPRNGDAPLQLDVFNIHLSLRAMIRDQQIQRLLKTADITHLSPTTPCIIAGDSNDWRGLLHRRIFKPAGFSCATNRHPASNRSIKTFPSFAPTGGLDKVYYRGDLALRHVARSRLKLARVASDHLPVIADFELTAIPSDSACHDHNVVAVTPS